MISIATKVNPIFFVPSVVRSRLQNMFAINKNRDPPKLILPVQKQIKTWRKACRKMGWRITEEEFKRVTNMPLLSEDDIQQGFIGAALFYGFGDDGSGNSDVLQ